jgi:ComF family protein
MPLRRIYSLYYYEGVVREMIREAKYHRTGRSLIYFAEEMFLHARIEFPRVKALVPVPLHKDREWERSFNQAAFLAQELSRLWGIPVWNCLRKNKATLPQSALSGQARRKNLKGAFLCKSSEAPPKSVLLIDDVTTTGATLEECARVLRRAGVRSVYGLTIARAVKTDTLQPQRSQRSQRTENS